MGSRDFIGTFAIDDELASGSAWKSIRLAGDQRHDAVSNDSFRKIAGADSSYHVGGVEEQPHEPGINPSLRRQR
jgi:hypothetical protein